jgi:hypothetical protein
MKRLSLSRLTRLHHSPMLEHTLQVQANVFKRNMLKLVHGAFSNHVQQLTDVSRGN